MNVLEILWIIAAIAHLISFASPLSGLSFPPARVPLQPWAVALQSQSPMLAIAPSRPRPLSAAKRRLPDGQWRLNPVPPGLKLADRWLHWSRGVSSLLSLAVSPSVKVVPVDNPRLPFFPASLDLLEFVEGGGIQALNAAGAWSPGKAARPKAESCLSIHQMALVHPLDRVFQLWVHNKAVAEFPTQEKATVIAQQVQKLLNAPDFEPASLYPAQVEGQYVGKAADRLLFTIDPDLAKPFNRSPELLAIAWVNNLRMALKAPPLSLVEAQIQMHNLIPTGKRIKGNASWYGPELHGNLTATGESFDPTDLTAAHPSLPFDTYLEVTNLKTGNAVIVRVNDRGPYTGDRALDLSPEAARCLSSKMSGVVPFEAVVMEQPGAASKDPATFEAIESPPLVPPASSPIAHPAPSSEQSD